MGAAAAQMKSCVHIIGGHWKRSLLPAPSLSGVRPTPARVRETVFNWLGQRLEGYTCVDLFAGSGALGFVAARPGLPPTAEPWYQRARAPATDSFHPACMRPMTLLKSLSVRKPLCGRRA